jgi:hypothetical protein
MHFDKLLGFAKVALTGKYTDLNNLPDLYTLAKQVYDNKEIYITGTI